MYRLKWPVDFSSIAKWTRDKLTAILNSNPVQRIRKLPKIALVSALLITFLVGSNTLFWWYRATHGGFNFGKAPEQEQTQEWEIDLSEQVLDEEELRKEYTVINPNQQATQEESPEVAEAPPGETESEVQENKPEAEPEEVVQKVAQEPETKPEEAAPASSLATMAMPTVGKVITAFAMDTLVYSQTLEQWNTHNGIDIAADLGTAVKAAMKGTVAEVIPNDPRLGVVVILDHGDGIQTLYGNLQSDKLAKKGDTVEKGQVIGAVGKTAPFEIEDPPHLHFEVIKDGKNIDPQQYLPKLN